MSEDQRYGPSTIEGEYEVIEEWDVNNKPFGDFNDTFLPIDQRPPYVTYAILVINTAMWLIMNLAGYIWDMSITEQLQFFGAKVNWLIADGQFWRLFTAMFLHIGFMHLFFNSYALYLYGPLVERFFGKKKFIIVYILSGLVGSLLSYLFSSEMSAGASGAIFGLMGSLLYFRQRKRRIFERIFGMGLFFVIGINLFYGFTQSNIDNWGHIGGLAGGYLVATATGLYREPMTAPRRLLAWLTLGVVFTTGIWFGNAKYDEYILFNRGLQNLSGGRIEEARQNFDELSEEVLQKQEVRQYLDYYFRNYAQKALDRGNLDEAAYIMGHLVNLYPEDAEYLYLRAMLYDGAGRYQEALSDYSAILQMDHGSLDSDAKKEWTANLWYLSGRAAYRTGDMEKAQAYLKKALHINPLYKEAESLLDAIQK